MKKYLKIFVVCFALVALLTVSCFATSVQTTGSTSAVYGHYISPGDYAFNETISKAFYSSAYTFSFHFVSNSSDYYGFRIYEDNDLVYFLFADNFTNYVGAYNSNGWVSPEFRFFTILDGFYISDPILFSWWKSNVTRVSPGYDSNLLDGFFSSFTMIGQWISGAANTLTSMFWSNNSLTFLGTLAVSALAFAVAFLIIGLISRFLRFRG